jgi:hypothetical protein
VRAKGKRAEAPEVVGLRDAIALAPFVPEKELWPNPRCLPLARCSSELAVSVLPLLLGRNGLDGVPVLGNLAALYPKQVVKRGVSTSE